MSETKNITGAGTFLTQWSYYANDAVKTMTYPGGNSGQAGEVVTYEYNPQTLLKSMHSPEMNYVPEIVYDAAGRVDEMTLGEGLNNGVISPILEKDYSYYAWNTQSGRMQSSYVQSLISNINLQTLTYTYDPNGNSTQMIDARQSGSETLKYQYDSLNRLRTVNGAYSEFVTYDDDGRIADRTMPDETVPVIWDNFRTKDLTNWTWSTYTTVPYEYENDRVVKSSGNTNVYATGFSRSNAIAPETTINLRFRLSQIGSNASFYFGLSPVECSGGNIMSVGEATNGNCIRDPDWEPGTVASLSQEMDSSSVSSDQIHPQITSDWPETYEPMSKYEIVSYRLVINWNNVDWLDVSLSGIGVVGDVALVSALVTNVVGLGAFGVSEMGEFVGALGNLKAAYDLFTEGDASGVLFETGKGVAKVFGLMPGAGMFFDLTSIGFEILRNAEFVPVYQKKAEPTIIKNPPGLLFPLPPDN